MLSIYSVYTLNLLPVMLKCMLSLCLDMIEIFFGFTKHIVDADVVYTLNYMQTLQFELSCV